MTFARIATVCFALTIAATFAADASAKGKGKAYKGSYNLQSSSQFSTGQYNGQSSSQFRGKQFSGSQFNGGGQPSFQQFNGQQFNNGFPQSQFSGGNSQWHSQSRKSKVPVYPRQNWNVPPQVYNGVSY